MMLNVNSPAYFSREFFVDNDVYRMCQSLRFFMKDKTYSDCLNIIGVMPVAAPEHILAAGAWKEEIKFLGKNTCASICIRMNFDEYANADSAGKVNMMAETIRAAVKAVSKKAKVKFDFVSFEKDFDLFLSRESER